ncbi:MAG: 30S ribosomal protein S16 [Verrucomicrobia bacterium]|nr:30S ribosomal protein S16 [Verrucomicrobiota bacterium]MBS0645555.1 30S ribosomal protein S16 [Verrucomicrobiota bacterium]
MALKIRLRQQGRRNLSVYRLVLTDVRTRRDGKYVELLGFYDPNHAESVVKVETERLRHWLNLGAELSDRAESLIKKIAPELVKELRDKQAVSRAKVCAKKRAARKNKETVTA